MSEDKKHQVPPILNTQNMRPALRKKSDDLVSETDRTNNLRPPEISRPKVVPIPPKQTNKDVVDLNEPTNDIPSGCFKFTSWMILQLDIVGTNDFIRVTPIESKSLIIGRNPESAPQKIDIDLSDYVAADDGVSRVHAAVALHGYRLELEDRNSTNGTYINNIRFNPNESHPIRSGDIIRLGNFQMIANFTPRLTSNNSKQTDILPPQR